MIRQTPQGAAKLPKPATSVPISRAEADSAITDCVAALHALEHNTRACEVAVCCLQMLYGLHERMLADSDTTRPALLVEIDRALKKVQYAERQQPLLRAQAANLRGKARADLEQVRLMHQAFELLQEVAPDSDLDIAWSLHFTAGVWVYTNSGDWGKLWLQEMQAERARLQVHTDQSADVLSEANRSPQTLQDECEAALSRCLATCQGTLCYKCGKPSRPQSRLRACAGCHVACYCSRCGTLASGLVNGFDQSVTVCLGAAHDSFGASWTRLCCMYGFDVPVANTCL